MISPHICVFLHTINTGMIYLHYDQWSFVSTCGPFFLSVDAVSLRVSAGTAQRWWPGTTRR